MKHVPIVATFACLACITSASQAGTCIDKHANDPNFVQLTVAENAPRPADAAAFSIVDGTITVDKLSEKVGPPDGSTSSGVKTTILVWCVPDGEVRVSTRDGSNIEQVRHNGKVVFDRRKGRK